MSQKDKQFIEFVGDIIKQSAKNAKTQGLSLGEAVDMTNKNLRKFIDYATAFIEVDESMMDKIVTLFPAFIPESEKVKEDSVTVDAPKPRAKKLVNTGRTNFSSYPSSSPSPSSSSSCGSSSSYYSGYSSSSCAGSGSYGRGGSSC